MRVGDLDSGDLLLTAVQVAERAGIGHRTLLSYLSDGRVERVPEPDARVGRSPLWRESTVASWLAARS